MPTHTLTKKPLTARKMLEEELKTLHRETATEDRAAAKALKELEKDANKKISGLIDAARMAEKSATELVQGANLARKKAAWKQATYNKKCSQLDLARERKNKGRAKRIAILESRLAAI